MRCKICDEYKWKWYDYICCIWIPIYCRWKCVPQDNIACCVCKGDVGYCWYHSINRMRTDDEWINMNPIHPNLNIFYCDNCKYYCPSCKVIGSEYPTKCTSCGIIKCNNCTSFFLLDLSDTYYRICRTCNPTPNTETTTILINKRQQETTNINY